MVGLHAHEGQQGLDHHDGVLPPGADQGMEHVMHGGGFHRHGGHHHHHHHHCHHKFRRGRGGLSVGDWRGHCMRPRGRGCWKQERHGRGRALNFAMGQGPGDLEEEDILELVDVVEQFDRMGLFRRYWSSHGHLKHFGRHGHHHGHHGHHHGRHGHDYGHRGCPIRRARRCHRHHGDDNSAVGRSLPDSPPLPEIEAGMAQLQLELQPSTSTASETH